jgi:hypothetical protein
MMFRYITSGWIFQVGKFEFYGFVSGSSPDSDEIMKNTTGLIYSGMPFISKDIVFFTSYVNYSNSGQLLSNLDVIMICFLSFSSVIEHARKWDE